MGVAANLPRGGIGGAVGGREVRIGVDIGLGSGRARIWTCDLTEGYIRINGSYRS